MRYFLRTLGKVFNTTRIVILNLFFFGFLFLLFAAIPADEQRETVQKDGSLILALNGQIVEQETVIDSLFESVEDDRPNEILLFDLIESIEFAAADDRVERLIILPGMMYGASFAALDELGKAIDTFKASGKPVLASAESYSQGGYYLASFADEILISPMGGVDVSGIAIFRTYFGEFLKRFGIDVHVFKVGTYKSAVEPFIERGMSAAARQNAQEWSEDLWQRYVAQVEHNRGLADGAITRILDHFPETLSAYDGDFAQMAVGVGLVDVIAVRESRIDSLKAFANDDSDGFGIHWSDYLAQVRGEQMLSFDHDGDVGVILASGEIRGGDQPAGVIGGDSLASLIKQAREDERVDALVIRVNSPGGSAFASEVIREELLATQEANIPVVISMGGVAASGGYWISTSADYIYANAQTITGSIGVFGLIPTFERLSAEYDIYSDGVATTPMAGAFDPINGLAEPAARTIQMSVENTYREFLDIVAEGRNTTPEAIDKIAQGRVWSGQRALELGLVDELGGLSDAIAKAGALAKVENPRASYITQPLSPYQEFLQSLAEETSILLSEPSLSARLQARFATEVERIEALNDPNHVYATCENCTIQ